MGECVCVCVCVCVCGLIFNRRIGNISKKGGVTREGWRKNRGRLRPSKKLCARSIFLFGVVKIKKSEMIGRETKPK